MGSAKGKEIKISEEAINIYRAFKQKEGSEQIAGPITIQVILNICQNNPKRILEMGGGIGTISYTLLKNSDAFVDIYEVDDFCLNKLKENLSGLEGRYQIIENYRILPPQREYDLIIVDGGINPERASKAVQAGANTLIVGSYIWNSKDVTQAIEEIKKNV